MQERKWGAGRWSRLRSQASPWDGNWYGFLASFRKEFKSHSKVKDGLFRKIHTPDKVRAISEGKRPQNTAWLVFIG